MNSFCYFSCENTDEDTCDHSGNQEYRGIIEKAGIFYNKGGYDQLSDIVGHTTCDADAQDAESGKAFHKGHHCKAQSSTCHTVKDTEHVSEHKADHQDPDHGYKSSLFPGVCFQDKKYCKVGKTKFDPRYSCKKRNQRFYITKDNGNGCKKPHIGDFFLFHNVIQPYQIRKNLPPDQRLFLLQLRLCWGGRRSFPRRCQLSSASCRDDQDSWRLSFWPVRF